MTTHELKTWPEPFEAVWRGLKTYEIRKDDRGFVVGDLLLLREWQPEREWTTDGHRLMPEAGYDGYTGRVVLATVSYVTRGPAWDVPLGMIVMALDNGRACYDYKPAPLSTKAVKP